MGENTDDEEIGEGQDDDTQSTLPVSPEPAQDDPADEQLPPRWKKRALIVGGFALGASFAAAIAMHLKRTLEAQEDDGGESEGEGDDDDGQVDAWDDDKGEDDEDEDEDEDDEDDDWVVDEDLAAYLDDQQEIVARLIVEGPALDEDAWQELYDQLDDDHQMQASHEIAEWADDAVGDPSWRSDQ